MEPIWLILLLLGGCIALLVGELLLPTHGVLGVLGVMCLGGMIAVCFYVNQWIGLTVFLAAILSSQLLLNVGMRLWKQSPVGRRLILQPVQVAAAPSPVKLGQIGVTVTELRPMGECDFGEHRLEALSELGFVQPGQKVKVVAIEHGRPTVRVAEST
jgi:membrane-bound serine protease (ClpP class)